VESSVHRRNTDRGLDARQLAVAARRVTANQGNEVEADRSLVERYRKRAEEIRALASAMCQSEERATLLEIAEEYERAP
jgi:hypothetical protein